MAIEIKVGPRGQRQWRRCRPGKGKSDWFQDLPFTPKLVVLPAGTFRMGSKDPDMWAEPVHDVEIPAPFAVSRTPITFDEWDAALADKGVRYRPHDGEIFERDPDPAHCGPSWGRGQRPVINISWKDAQAYVRWLSKKTGHDYRLLTEAEWEYACRAGTKTAYATGKKITKKQARFEKLKTSKVGRYPPNAWGLYDMHGNVYEWVEDYWHFDYEGAPANGEAWLIPDDFPQRVVRGGCWIGDRALLKSAHRTPEPARMRNCTIGMRVARSLRVR